MPNDLPMTVRNTWDPISFNTEAANFHLAAWKYEGRRLAFEISHSLTDGTGVLPYVQSVLYLYLSKATGSFFDPAGFRLPGQVIPESETGNPFRDLDVDGAAPLYQNTVILCAITCIGHSFFLAFMQPFSSPDYFRCFLEELTAAGIQYELLRSEPLRLCNIR